MPTSTRGTPLGRYRYDALDRQVECTPFQQAAIQSFYCQKRLSSEIQSAVQRSIVQHDDQLLAQQQCEGGKVVATLLATDQQRSVSSALEASRLYPFAYTPYGHRLGVVSLPSIPGFNGERPDPVTRHYHLGNGYRQFNPVLMRFNSPDSMSPFGKGGFNAYSYCGADPINRSDPTGHSFMFVLQVLGAGVTFAGTVTAAVGTIIGNPDLKTIGWIAVPLGGAAMTIGRFGGAIRYRAISIAGSRPPPSYAVARDMPRPRDSVSNVSTTSTSSSLASPPTYEEVMVNWDFRSVNFSKGPIAGQSAAQPGSSGGTVVNNSSSRSININGTSLSRRGSSSSSDVESIRR